MPGKQPTQAASDIKQDQNENCALVSGGFSFKAVSAIFSFICVITAVRSCEAGIIAAMMEDIQSSLGLSLGIAGQVAAAPDYGLVPGAIGAAVVLTRVIAHRMLTVCLFGISVLMLFCALFPSGVALVVVRACAGFFWGLVAVHCPAWINKYGQLGQEDKRTNWMGLYNAFLLIGIVLGYVLGAYSTRWWLGEIQRWTLLYIANALCMLGCALWCYAYIAPGLVQVIDFGPNDEEIATPQRNKKAQDSWLSALGLPREWGVLFASRIYVFAIMFSGSVAGCSAFILYFVAQLTTEALSMENTTGFAVVLSVMVTAPLPGNLLGAGFLSYLGGYKNQTAAFAFTVGCAIASLTFCLLLAYSAFQGSTPLFIVFFYFFLFFSSAPTAAGNGLAVNAVPEVATHASGLQFAVQNTAKLVVPGIGGFVLERLGMITGFFVVVTACVLSSLTFCTLGYFEARRLADAELLAAVTTDCRVRQADVESRAVAKTD